MNQPTSNRVIVDPVTRIEGHLRIEAETDAEGRITRASSAGTMVRGIELILRGRDPREAWASAHLRRLHFGAWSRLGALGRECAED
jgi:hydrogenase large subunit